VVEARSRRAISTSAIVAMITPANLSAASVVLRSEEESALAPLVLAFAKDPAARWIYPNAHHFRTFFPRFVRALAGQAFTLGTARRVEDFRGTALWLAPGIASDDHALVPLIEETVPSTRRADVFAMFEKMGGHRPTDPHWYLPFIGIDPRHQGRGLGSTLLGHTLAECDREGVAVYLEASNPRIVPFYERHGFQLHGEIQVGDSPTLFPMVRFPRSHIPHQP
jgi:ribosomal protein S18 acetylase RimI-like enzyme